jgi:Flp pilus assembly protein TadB
MLQSEMKIMTANHMSDPRLHVVVVMATVVVVVGGAAAVEVVVVVVVAVLQVALVMVNWTRSNHNMEFPSDHQPHFVSPPA